MFLRNQLTSDFAGIILGAVKDNGWLTEISDGVGINRCNFNRRKMAKMPLQRLLRIMTGLAWKMPRLKFSIMWMALGKLVYDMGDQHYFEFADEMKPAVRMAALMELPVKFIWTHDAFRVGEDGPTHEPVEQEAQIRLMEKQKNHHGRNSVLVVRPADAEENTVCWRMAMENTQTPTALIISRQNIDMLPAGKKKFGLTAGLPVTLEGLVGGDGCVWGLQSFGFSAPYKVLDEKLGYTGQNVYEQVKKLLG